MGKLRVYAEMVCNMWWKGRLNERHIKMLEEEIRKEKKEKKNGNK